ncbi:MAG: SUMF1/EgtB/PvdO family nonheme iron enzyme [Verrucomicrobia bacterium]|nr:SUMF1/EgtB/PvdO family nonheme iron enzyme [Verrucomicrobiota bacterium]
MRSDEAAALFARSATFGNFEIPLDPATGEQRELGRGGMGVTYLARDSKLGRLVVLKVVSRALQADPQARKRFLREARALAYLRHPCIPVLYDFGEVAGDDFYTMEYIEGEDLHKRVRRDGPLPLPEALWVAEQAASALAEAHRVGIVHRDVKPANLMVAPAAPGALPTVKLIDFGLAKDTGGEADLGVSSSGSAGFTPLYASPEQVKQERATPASDLYSLGASLWFLLSGQPPFRGNSAYEVEIKHVSVPPPWQTLPESIPAPVKQLLARLLAKKPAERPPGAAELALELRALREAAPAEAKAGGAAATSASAGDSLSNAPTLRAAPSPSAEATAAAGSQRILVAALVAVVLALGLVALALRSPPDASAANPAKLIPGHVSATLGMPFHTVPGAPPFAAWKVRVKDFALFAAARPNTEAGGLLVLRVEQTPKLRAAWVLDPAASWRQPGFAQGPDHPVVGVSWELAREFCRWLTEKERAEGRIAAPAEYRLPTVAEWSSAVGNHLYPWGPVWPPPSVVGNFCDETTAASLPGRGWPRVPLTDRFERTAPVTAFPPYSHGLHDLAGNAWEWCEDAYQPSMNAAEIRRAFPELETATAQDGTPLRALRGSSWFTSNPLQLRSDFVDRQNANCRHDGIGFRLVFDPGGRR